MFVKKNIRAESIDDDGDSVPTQIKNPDLVRQRRRQIVDSTVSLFVNHGYHKTTTRMIAKAAGFSIGSLYEYVSSKEDVLYLVCQAIHSEAKKALEETLSDPKGGIDTLSKVIREYLFVCDQMIDHILLMYQVAQFLPEKWKKKVLVDELKITNIFIGVLENISGTADIPTLDKRTIALVAHNISVLGHMWAFRRWYLLKQFTIDEYIDHQTDFILGLIFQNTKETSLKT